MYCISSVFTENIAFNLFVLTTILSAFDKMHTVFLVIAFFAYFIVAYANIHVFISLLQTLRPNDQLTSRDQFCCRKIHSRAVK